MCTPNSLACHATCYEPWEGFCLFLRPHLCACACACAVQWPSVHTHVVPPNAGLKLFGGAAFERCLNEFQEAAHAMRFPSGQWTGGIMCDRLIDRRQHT